MKATAPPLAAAQITAILGSAPHAKHLFVQYVEQEESDAISVSEVKLAFPANASLLEVRGVKSRMEEESLRGQ